MGKFKSMVGCKFNRLTVIAEFAPHMGERGRLASLVRCVCECGNTKDIVRYYVKSGDVKSCGCLKREMSISRRGLKKSPSKDGIFELSIINNQEYHVWIAIRNRCTNKKLKAYPNYGGRGISVCKEWAESFEAFYADMGARPTMSHSIDRINNDGDYCKENCRWATREEQANNRRNNIYIEYNGERLTISMAARKYNLVYNTLRLKVASNKYTTEECIKMASKNKHKNAATRYELQR